jgi:hypothetical protein
MGFVSDPCGLRARKDPFTAVRTGVSTADPDRQEE